MNTTWILIRFTCMAGSPGYIWDQYTSLCCWDCVLQQSQKIMTFSAHIYFGVDFARVPSLYVLFPFQMTVSKFQELRFHVASVLSEMEKLEKHSILKIKD